MKKLQSTRRQSTRKLTITAMLTAIAIVLMYLEVPMPFMPPFLKFDISAVPILLGSFMFGPLTAFVMCAIKSAVHLLSTQTGGVGELADLIITASFAVTAGFIYKYNRTRKGAFLGVVAGSAAIAVAGVLANKFILIPFYSKIMPIDVIIEVSAAVNPYINSIDTYLLFGIIPFNLMKAIAISFVTFLTYKRLSKVIKSYIAK